ncbi:hypothetical protein C8F01DRAFT_1092454 [Mycena amicta]|nr:hypothetical protein C8F01DRAFT_1092454 [Mycena amicta]
MAESSHLIVSAMDALEAEGYADRYTPSIASVPQSPMRVSLRAVPEPARPFKRRKLNHRVSARYSAARFLDTEAVEADGPASDDDADSDDSFFIDDEPIHAHPLVSRQYSPEGDSDAEDNAWKELAAEYERRAACERGLNSAVGTRALTLMEDQSDANDNAWDYIAAGYERRAALERNTPLASATVSVRPNTLEEKMAEISLVMRLPSLLSPPMYTIRILPYWEYRLMRHILSCPGVLSSGTWGVGSGVVFVETRRVGYSGETGLLAAHLREWKTAYRFYNRDLLVPRLCPVSERTRLLQPPGDPRFVHPYDIGNRWVRVSLPGIYYNDIAFVEETDPTDHGQRLRVVPRLVISFGDNPFRPPQRLLEPDRFRAFYPEETLELRNQILLWKEKKREFGTRNYFQGLELLQIDQPNFLTPAYARNAFPTEEELNLFRGCSSPQLNVPFTGFTCALQDGDRVVDAHTASLYARTGVIYSIFPQDVQGLSKPVRFARVLPEYDGAVVLHLGSQEVEAGWTVAVSELRLHILAIRRPIRVGDRIRSVLGPDRPQLSLRVSEVRHDSVEVYDTNVTSEQPLAFELQLRHVVHDFREGDIVRVLRGNYMGQRCLLVSLLPGGYVTLYPGNVEDGLFRIVPYGHLEPVTLHSAPNPYKKRTEDDDLELGLNTTLHSDTLARINEKSIRPEITIRLATNFICFENWDSDDTQLARSRDKKPWEEMDSTTRALFQKMRDNEQWLIGMFVRVTGMHDLKGRCGDIKGYSWTCPRPEKGRPDYGSIELAVGLELRTNTDRLPFHCVVERDSGLPLHEAHVLMEYGKIRHYERPHTPTGGDVVEPDETWPGQKSILPPMPVPLRWNEDEMSGEYDAPPDVGDGDGTWLLHASFVDKRIDVVVVDRVTMDTIKKSSQRMTRQVNDKQFKLVDAKGHLKILTQPLKASDTSSAMVGFISSEGKPCSMPLKALLPCRQHPDGTSISQLRGRVIVIGPDVFGSLARIGQYAEVLPGVTRWPDRVIEPSASRLDVALGVVCLILTARLSQVSASSDNNVHSGTLTSQAAMPTPMHGTASTCALILQFESSNNA